MSQSCFSLGFLSQNSLWKLSTFCGHKGIYSRVWEGMWKVIFFCKTRCFGKSLTTGTSREFQSPNNWMVRLYFLPYNDPAILTLQLIACFTHVLDFGKSPVARSLWLHTLDQFFTLSHTQPLHYSHLNIGFINAKLQADLTQNKTNT